MWRSGWFGGFLDFVGVFADAERRRPRALDLELALHRGFATGGIHGWMK